MIFGELEAFASLVERAKRWFGRPAARKDSVATRFIEIFEKHGVHRNQIPRFLDRRLSLAEVNDEDLLLSALNEKVLDLATTMFAVRRPWLDGADSQIYPLHDFYKHPDEFATWVDALCKQPGTSTGVLLVADPPTHECDTLLIFEEQFAWIGEKPIYRYHLCNNWLFSYWKSRAYLTACVAAAWKRSIYVSGRKTDIETLQRFQDGETFLDYSFESALPMAGHHWYPEDMALKPEVFLDGLDEGDFGRRSALEMWLKLDERGFMESDLPAVPSEKPVFASALQDLHSSTSGAE